MSLRGGEAGSDDCVAESDISESRSGVEGTGEPHSLKGRVSVICGEKLECIDAEDLGLRMRREDGVLGISCTSRGVPVDSLMKRRFISSIASSVATLPPVSVRRMGLGLPPREYRAVLPVCCCFIMSGRVELLLESWRRRLEDMTGDWSGDLNVEYREDVLGRVGVNGSFAVKELSRLSSSSNEGLASRLFIPSRCSNSSMTGPDSRRLESPDVLIESPMVPKLGLDWTLSEFLFFGVVLFKHPSKQSTQLGWPRRLTTGVSPIFL